MVFLIVASYIYYCWLQIIWNSSTRAELLKFVDEQRASQGPDGSYDLTDSQAFQYEALSKELYVGNVYLRVYNDQPDFDISEPEAFCVALVEFISCLVHSQHDVATDGQVSGSLLKTLEHQNDAGKELSNEQHYAEDSVASSDVKMIGTEDCSLVKNLQFGLTSLQVCSYLFLWLTIDLGNSHNCL